VVAVALVVQAALVDLAAAAVDLVRQVRVVRVDLAAAVLVALARRVLVAAVALAVAAVLLPV
jgi:hypothetical protein